MMLALGVAVAGCAADRTATVADAPEAAAPAAFHASDDLVDVPVEQQPWQFAGYDGQILITPHYALHTTLSRHSVLDRLPLFMERGLVQYTTAFGRLPMPGSRQQTYLFETRNQWEAKTRQMLPDQAGTFLTLGRGGFTTRGTSVLYYIGRNDTLAIAAHEGWGIRFRCGSKRGSRRTWRATTAIRTASPSFDRGRTWSDITRCGGRCVPIA
jgi:hypothetical protein